MKTEIIKLTPRQSSFIQAYSSPDSPSFSNCYQSAIAVGYSDKTARNLTYVKPKWLGDLGGQITLGIEPEQLRQALTEVIQDYSEPTIVRLRAIELMMKHRNMFQEHQTSQSVSINVDLTGGLTD